MQTILARIELFAAIPLEGLAALAERGRKRTFFALGLLMRQGDVCQFMHVIVKGRVRVERWHPALTAPMVLEELGPGELVGELGVLDDKPRSDAVVAVEDTETLELDRATLAQTLLRFPNASSVLLPVLSRQLRSIDEFVPQTDELVPRTDESVPQMAPDEQSDIRS